jgi:integrase
LNQSSTSAAGGPSRRAIQRLPAPQDVGSIDGRVGDVVALVEDAPGHRTLSITHKGGKIATIPLAPRTARAIDLCASPHSLRHSFITAALDAGAALRDVQEAASHADPRTTMRYDRARRSLDRHATHIVATFVAGSSR